MVVDNVEYKLTRLGTISALLGYAFSFYSFYLFHLISILFLTYIFFIKKKIKINVIVTIYPLLVLVIYSIFSLFWTPNVEIGLRNVFYIFNGLIVVLFLANGIKSESDLNKIYKVVMSIALINFIIGFFESLGVFRLPMSPYSPYASYFGYKSSDLTNLLVDQISSVLSKPTGFNGNPNTFGFVFIMLFPFLFFYNKALKALSLFFLVFFNFYLQSRGVFLATIVFVLLYTIFNVKRNYLYLIFLLPISIFALMYLDYDFSDMRIASSFDSVTIGLSNIKLNEVNLYSNSTDVRSSIYLIGLNNLLESPLFGLGIGGIQSVLVDMDSPILSFHFYFLEALVDYGFIFYIIFIGYYIKLIKKIYKIYKRASNISTKNIVQAIFYSLCIIPVASISPSSIVYNLSAWTVIGLALVIVSLSDRGKLIEK